jgi:hypothetical protein
MKPIQEVCRDKNILLDTHEKSSTAYSIALTALLRKMSMLSQTEYEALYDITEELRIKARGAQEAVLRHIAEHGC